MVAFLLADVQVSDVDAYRATGYTEAAMATSSKYGGVYRALGGEITVLEGSWDPGAMIVIEFPSMDDLMAWYHSPEYQKWIEVRLEHAPDSRLVALQGAS